MTTYMSWPNDEPGGAVEVPVSDGISSRSSQFLLVLLALSLGGCQGAFWGNLVVLGVTFGIFFGTLALGRSTSVSPGAEASSSASRTVGRG